MAGDMLSQAAEWPRYGPELARLLLVRLLADLPRVSWCEAEGAELRHLPGSVTGVASPASDAAESPPSRHEPAPGRAGAMCGSAWSA